MTVAVPAPDHIWEGASGGRYRVRADDTGRIREALDRVGVPPVQLVRYSTGAHDHRGVYVWVVEVRGWVLVGTRCRTRSVRLSLLQPVPGNVVTCSRCLHWLGKDAVKAAG